jgi:hypothetical protein
VLDELVPRFGVLYVGGSAGQRSGDSLASFGTALYSWLNRWHAAREKRDGPGGRGMVQQFSGAVLSGGPGGEDGPAHLRLALGQLDSGGSCAEWLVAESCWASIFDVPEFLGLARWIWKVSTCLLVLQFVIPMRRHWQLAGYGKPAAEPGRSWESEDRSDRSRVPHLAIAGCYVVLMGAAAMLSVVLSLILLALAVADKLPIPRIDGAVRWTVTRISCLLGDSYMLAHCPVQYAAMRTQVARDLHWLRSRCDGMAVVAHSQGAAVAHQVLREMADQGKMTDPGDDDRPGELRAFITLGQGISKFLLLRNMDWDGTRRVRVWVSRALVTAGMICAGLPALGKLISHWTSLGAWTTLNGLPWAAALIVAGLACITAGVHMAMRTFCDQSLRDELDLSGHIRCRWTDYYASADPVSNGPADWGSASGTMPPRQRGLPGQRFSIPVYSNASALTDNVSYLRNQDQVLPNLLNDLLAAACRTTGDSVGQLVSDKDITQAGINRHRLNTALIAARVMTVALAAWLWWINLGPAATGPMNNAVRLIAPGAGITTGIARPIAVALIVVIFYGGTLILWKIGGAFLTRRFFRKTAGKPVPDTTASQSSARDQTVTAAAT